MFLADFKNVKSELRNELFLKYCMSFYGTQILPIFDNTFDDICKAWRVVVRRVWRIHPQTRCKMLPYIAGVMDPLMWFHRRCIRFINSALTSRNDTVKYISTMGTYGIYSIMGNNFRFLNEKYDMNDSSVNGKWKEMYDEYVFRVCDQVKELIKMRDDHCNNILTRDECKDMIDFLCLEESLESPIEADTI